MDAQNLVGRKLFTFILNQEIHKATRLQYPVSILCLTPDRGPPAAPSSFPGRLARRVVQHVRATDLVTDLDVHQIALLLVDAETRNLSGIVERLKEGLGFRTPLTVSGGGSCYPQTASDGRELLQQAVDLMRQAKREGGGRLYLPS